MPYTMEQIFGEKIYNDTESFKSVQRRYRRKLNFNAFPNRSRVIKLDKKFKAHDICEDLRAMGSSPFASPITNLHAAFNSAFD